MPEHTTGHKCYLFFVSFVLFFSSPEAGPCLLSSFKEEKPYHWKDDILFIDHWGRWKNHLVETQQTSLIIIVPQSYARQLNCAKPVPVTMLGEIRTYEAAWPGREIRRSKPQELHVGGCELEAKVITTDKARLIVLHITALYFCVFCICWNYRRSMQR